MTIYHKSGIRRYITLYSMYTPGIITYKYKIHNQSALMTNNKTLLKQIKR